MTPLPKRKISPGRRDRRRAHDHLKASASVNCPNCGEPVCPIVSAPSADTIRVARLFLSTKKTNLY